MLEKIKLFILGFFSFKTKNINIKVEVVRLLILLTIFIFLNSFPFPNRDEFRSLITLFMIFDALIAALCIYRLINKDS